MLAAGGLVPAASAIALGGGDPVADGADPFVAKITTEGRACTGALVAPQWVLTASSCVPENAQQPGTPAKPATVVVGQANLAGSGGQVMRVASVASRTDRDVMLLKLPYPAAGITPLKIGTAAPVAGDALRADGFGRTDTEWVPDRLRTAWFTAGTPDTTTFAITSANGKDACRGDAGGPLLRATSGGTPELGGIVTRSWEHGCLSSTETRQGGTAARTDDLAAWVAEQTAPKTVRIKNRNNQRCVAVQGANNVNDAPAFQFDCDPPQQDQEWDLVPVDGGGVMLRNHYTKRCLIVHGANNTNGAASMQYDCLPQFGDQLWDLVPANGGVQIKNRATGRCLVAFASNNTNGAPAAQYDCLPQYTDQVWDVAPFPG